MHKKVVRVNRILRPLAAIVSLALLGALFILAVLAVHDADASGQARVLGARVVAALPPAAPVLAPISNPDGNGDYLVNWNNVEGATGYALQEDDNSSFTSPAERYSGANSQYQVTGQAAGTWYYRVRASNLGGDSPWSNTQSVVVDEPPLVAPALDPISNPDGDGDYLVDWSDVSGAITYTLEEDDNSSFTSPAVRYFGANSQFQVTGQPGGSWYYRARASNANGDSPWSNIESTSVIPAAPSLLPIDNPDRDGAYLVSWSAVTGTISYTLEEAGEPEFISPTVRYSGAESQYQVTGQGPGVWYYRVVASGAGGDSPSSNVESTGVVPGAPVLDPISNPNGLGSYLVDWSDASGATGYRLQEDDKPGFSSPTLRYSGPDSQYQVTAQAPGIWYYRVVASGAAGYSVWSNVESTGVVPDAPVLAPISNPGGLGSYLVDWSDASGATGYRLQEDDKPGFPSPTLRYSGPDSQYQVTAQAPGIWYYRVVASGAAGYSPWSNIESTGVVPAAPVLYAIDNPGEDDVYLVSWSAVTGTISYTLEEAGEPEFISPTVRYTGADSQFEVTGQAQGTWYYRVVASGDAGVGPWSNTELVTVAPHFRWFYLPLIGKGMFLDHYEPNDTFAEAWGPLISRQAYHAYFPTEADLNDFYYLDLPTTHGIGVLLTDIPAGNDYALYLYDAAYVLIGYSDKFGNQDEIIFLSMAAPQRYYLRVERVEGTSRTQPYALTAMFQ